MVLASILVCPISNFAQEPDTDTVSIIDKLIDKIDTLVNVVIADSTLERWAEQPVDSMLFRNSNSRFKKELYNLIFKSERDTTRTPTENTSFAAMDGRVIRRIDFRHVDMFAPTVRDTGYKPDSWFARLANSAHNDTRISILERYLLLKSGDRLDVFMAAENERILRDLSFIMDAWFIAKPVKGSPDSIDLVLITQDKFPLAAEAGLERATVGMVGITHQNVLGYGHQFSASTYFDAENHPHVGYGLSYGTTNIAGTFTTGRFDYLNRWNQKSFILDFSHDFRAISLERAGGFSFENTSIIQSIHLLDTIYELAEYKYSLTDIWIGRMIAPISQQTQYSRTRLYLAVRFSNYNNIDPPRINDVYLYPYSDRVRALISFGITQQGSRKDNLIYTFGRTEDVPYGYQFDLTTGYEWLQDRSRPYVSVSGFYGNYFGNSSYLSGQVQFGTFIYNGKSEQGVFRLQANYFSRLHKHNRFQFRNFATVILSKGINRYPGEYITLSNRRGIQGLASNSLRGIDKGVLNLESVLFTPYTVFGFKFAFFGGLDLGIIRREEDGITDSRLYSGINAGVRIRNDQLVFNTFIIKFSFYPGRPDDSTVENFTIGHVPRVRFKDFLPDRPEFVPYQ